ncbi:PIR protein, putative [Plasmodium sp.]|nr:PIR protein, putative [Plasmodium sp.]SCM18803.1 PIR protein, putative [Plasmodium sp.]
MKVHYINILLFALPLNILDHSKNKQSITHHTPKIPTTRLLCECELYAPANYDNDPQMKEVIENFNKQTQQRFEEYDDRMIEKRKHCKDKYDKEIQKIILKDKIEKELTEKFATLQTDIQCGELPECTCEKSLADKVEKNCLICGGMLSGGIAPSVRLFGAVALGAWKNAALDVGIKEALNAAAAEISATAEAAGIEAGIEEVITGLGRWNILKFCPEISKTFFNTTDYTNVTNISKIILARHDMFCNLEGTDVDMCTQFDIILGTNDAHGKLIGAPANDAIPKIVGEIVEGAKGAADTAAKTARETATAEITKNQTSLIEGGFNSSISSINASIIAILIIVLILVIIYLILRYRRKKKMKKKHQYIKLLEE